MSPFLPDQPAPSLEGHLIVFTGKLGSLGRKDARALVERLGGTTADDVNVRTTLLVVGGEGFGAGSDSSYKLRRAEELNAQGARIEIVPEDAFCLLVGVPAPGALKQQYYAMRDLLARYGRLREVHVRYLAKWGLVTPVLRTNADTFFAFGDVAVIRQVHEAVEAGHSFHHAVRAFVSSREGQLSLDFRLDASPAKVVALTPRAPARPAATKPDLPPRGRDTALAEEHFRAASALDDGDPATRDGAAASYRKALELDPYLVPAIINLANIHYSCDELVEAQALYERAIGLEPDVFEAHFNLGNIYHDLSRYGEAQQCYAEALRLNPFYPDTHFYLAVTLEKMGLSPEARPHWRAYRQLAPQGEWVELAREFSE